MQNVENAKLLGDESFVRFLSESREWAFEYIERVQESLTIFKERVGKKAEYHEKFGNVADSVHKESLDTFVKAYNDLIELLPKEEEKTEEKK
jgi:S-adenosylmethionine hydrolase